jgi:hypothetical protein
VNATMTASRTTAPMPIATFFQAFIELRHGPTFLDRGPDSAITFI